MHMHVQRMCMHVLCRKERGICTYMCVCVHDCTCVCVRARAPVYMYTLSRKEQSVHQPALRRFAQGYTGIHEGSMRSPLQV